MKHAGRSALFAAQALFSIGQLLITLTGSLVIAPELWGRTAILLSSFFVVAALLRGFTSLPILIYFAGDRDGALETRRAALLLGLAGATAGGLALTSVGMLLGIPATGALFAAALIGYTLYDSARTVEIAGAAYRTLLGADAGLMALLFAGSSVSLLFSTSLDATLTLPATMAVAYGVGALGLIGSHRTAASWSTRRYVRTFRQDMPFLAVDSLLMALTLSCFTFLLGTYSLQAAGEFRTSITVLVGPLQMLLTGAGPLVITALRREALGVVGTAHDRRWRTTLSPARKSATILAIGMAYGFVVTLVGNAVFALWGLSTLATAVPYAFGGSVLAAALMCSTVLSSFMRYRRPNGHLTAVRVASLLLSLFLFAAMTQTAAPSDRSLPLLVAAAPWLVVPLLHAFASWSPAARAARTGDIPAASLAPGRAARSD